MIEYSFSQLKYNGELQKVLRTKGEKTNYQIGKSKIFEKKMDDNTIIQSCIIKEKIKEDTDAEGNSYVWYLISNYEVKVDNSLKYNKELEKTNAALEFLFMMGGYEPFENGEDENEQNV